jgi:hypothetical protein
MQYVAIDLLRRNAFFTAPDLDCLSGSSDDAEIVLQRATSGQRKNVLNHGA